MCRTSPETSFSFMYRLKREHKTYDPQVMRLGTSYYYQLMNMRPLSSSYSGRQWYTYQRTTYTDYDGIGIEYEVTVGKWHHISKLCFGVA